MIPKRLHLYLALMRFDKPIGTLLLLWPTLWGLWLAFDGVPPANVFWPFLLGVFIMRSAGCVINDYADREIDPLVERTKTRPLASGELKPRDALTLFLVLCLVALLLLLCLPRSVWPWSIPALAITVAYPFMKRFIHYPLQLLVLVGILGACQSLPKERYYQNENTIKTENTLKKIQWRGIFTKHQICEVNNQKRTMLLTLI